MNAKIQKLLHRLRGDQRGLTTVEYVIALCLIAGVAVGLWKTFGDHIYADLGKADSEIHTAMITAPKPGQ
jgi:Flp pilus assembly pilin Flp